MKNDKKQALKRLNKVLDEIPQLKSKRFGSKEFEKWIRNTEVAIGYTFGEKSRHLDDFKNIRYSLIMFTTSTPDSAFQNAYTGGLDSAHSVLQSMIEEVEEYWEDQEPNSPAKLATDQHSDSLKRIFVIHGRDDGTKETVARFLSKIGADPVILHEQPNEGRTIIEKFEENSGVGFAIGLFTPDDLGKLDEKDSTLRPRARQNVLLEFGYFMGKLGRDKVCALTKGDVELPSDYTGVVYIPIDHSGGWKMTLVRELKSANIDVDANKAL